MNYKKLVLSLAIIAVFAMTSFFSRSIRRLVKYYSKYAIFLGIFIFIHDFGTGRKPGEDFVKGYF